MPRDLSEFANYVRTTVRHYAGRLQVWEIMNEPVYTEYALPRENGYSVADYVKLLEVAYQAVKEADPKAFVIGGIAAGPETLTADFVAAGGLKWVDAINIHTYPGMAYPERYLAGLEGLNAAMEKAGGRKPIWDTEGAYYADDDVPFAPFTWWGTQLETERECAAYQVRLDVILIAAGTRKIIYHSGTPGSLNREDPAGIFFEWDGAPRKMAASQAALTALLGLDTVSLGALSETPRAYGFRSRGKTVVVVWNDGEGDFALTPGREARLLDIVGNEVKERSVALGETPCYLVLDGTVAADQLRKVAGEMVKAAKGNRSRGRPDLLPQPHLPRRTDARRRVWHPSLRDGDQPGRG
jgi:hypothetical protein